MEGASDSVRRRLCCMGGSQHDDLIKRKIRNFDKVIKCGNDGGNGVPWEVRERRRGVGRVTVE